MRPSRPWYREAVVLYDRLYRFLHDLDTPGCMVGPVLRIEVRPTRRARTLPDGTRVGQGERIGILHLNNERLAALHGDGLSVVAAGLEFRRQFLISLHALATLVRPGAPLSDLPAFAATTIFHHGLARLGFQPELDGLMSPVLVAVYQRALLASLHPAGILRLRPSIYHRARRLWISRDALLARYGKAASRRALEATSGRPPSDWTSCA